MSALGRLASQMEAGRLDYAASVANRSRPAQGGGVAAGYHAATGRQLIAAPNGKVLPVKTVSSGGARAGTPLNYSLPSGSMPRTDGMPR